jgi:hypothetical protein
MTSHQTPTLILIPVWKKNIMSETKNHALFIVMGKLTKNWDFQMKHFKYIYKDGIENNIGDLKGKRIEEAPWIIKKD